MLTLGLAHLQPGKVTYEYTEPQSTPLAKAYTNMNMTAIFDYKPYGNQAPSVPADLGGEMAIPNLLVIFNDF